MTEILVEMNKTRHGVYWKARKPKRLWTPFHDLMRIGSVCCWDWCLNEISTDPWYKVEAMRWWGPGKHLPWLRTYRFCSSKHLVDWAEKWGKQ